MIVTLTKQFRFEASHRLDHLPESHPCFRLHGHSYVVEIEVRGAVDSSTGFLIDYGDLKKIAEPVIAQLDHTHLNDIEGLRMSSAEHIAKWIWDRLLPALPLLSGVTIRETASTSCTYRGA